MKLIKFAFILLMSSHVNAQIRALFIGNSYTASHNMTTMVTQAASSAGFNIVTSQHTPGGATLNMHTQNPNTYSLMSAQNWDFVVFQAQSQEPAFPYSQVSVQTLPYAAQLVDSVRSIVPCAQPTFFRTWGRKNGDIWNCASYPPICTYEGMDSLLHLRYRMMADSNDAFLSPVGSVWRYIRNTDTTIELYSSDGSHPSLAGSYVAACTFFTMFTRHDPTNITYNASLNANVAQTIRQATKAVVYDSLAVWNVGAFDVQAHIQYSMAHDTLDYSSTSINADSIYIEFGDGNGSSNATGQHVYGQQGQFNVELRAYRCNDVDSVDFDVQATLSNSGTPVAEMNVAHPNQLFNHWPHHLKHAIVFDLNGQLVWEASAGQIQPWIIEEQGVFILQCQWDDGQITRQTFGQTK